jgi:hypothetical protein
VVADPFSFDPKDSTGTEAVAYRQRDGRVDLGQFIGVKNRGGHPQRGRRNGREKQKSESETKRREVVLVAGPGAER